MSKGLIDFAELRRRARFDLVLAHYALPLLGRGAQRSILCPFHTEKNPSCKVQLKQGLFHCFGCGAKGNILDFVQRMEDATLTEAAEVLGRICDLKLPRREDQRAERTDPAERPARRRKAARGSDPPGQTTSSTETSHSEAPDEPEGPINPPLTFKLKLDPTHPYLAARGLSPELVETFGLGYANRGVMKGRICIPIHNEKGELVAYAGRWPADDGFPEGEDKYKLPLRFRKTHVLFNLHRVDTADELFIVEGYFSVFRLQALGVSAVAAMGSSISEEQVRLLPTHVTRVIALFDGDAAGRKARNDAVPLLAERFYVHAPLLPDGTSPDSIGEDVLRDVLRLL